MQVGDGRGLYSGLIVLEPDPWKYRNVHLKLRNLFSRYTPNLQPRSIDEFVLDFKDRLPYRDVPSKIVAQSYSPIHAIALGIKRKIKSEIGDWITVSIGIAPNRFLAKVASNFQKPDGLVEINNQNFLDYYLKLKLTDLPYIKERNATRLYGVGIYTTIDFYSAPLWKLKAAFASIGGYYWYLRLRGYEIDEAAWGRRTYGNSYALPRPLEKAKDLLPILTKLVVKMSARVRLAGYKLGGVHLAVFYQDGGYWHRGVSIQRQIFDTREIISASYRLLKEAQEKFGRSKAVRSLAVSSFKLTKTKFLQLDLFDQEEKKLALNDQIDLINKRWGDYVVAPARMINTARFVPDRIAFGSPR